MAKKTKGAKKHGAAKVVAVPAILAPSPCAQRGPEFPGWVYAQQGQTIQAYFLLCAAKAKLVVSLHAPSPTSQGGTPLFTGVIPPPNPVVITIPPLSRGHYLVYWTFAAAGPWEAVAEIHVEGVPRFRKHNSSVVDKIPVNAMWADLEIS